MSSKRGYIVLESSIEKQGLFILVVLSSCLPLMLNSDSSYLAEKVAVSSNTSFRVILAAATDAAYLGYKLKANSDVVVLLSYIQTLLRMMLLCFLFDGPA